MKNVKIRIALVLAVCCITTPKATANLVFDDGGTHNIDYALADHVLIYSPETFWEQIPTTLNINGAISGYCSVYDNSHVKMYAGSIGSSLSASENSQIDFFDGRIGGALGVYNYSTINMTGGEINSGLVLKDFGRAYVSGGTTQMISVHNAGKIYISGDSNWNSFVAYDDSYSEISGGDMETLIAYGNANIDFSGGTIEEHINIHDDSSLTVYGNDFQIDGVSVKFGTFGTHDGGSERHGLLTGTLANGDVLNNKIEISNNAQLILAPAHAPTEPPIADAGEDIIADADEAVILDASSSTDSNGHIVRYTWMSLPEGEILYSGEESSFTKKALGRVEEVIKLTVTDNDGASSEDTISIRHRRVEEIELIPGPEGPQGEIGAQGPVGEQGPPGITPTEIAQLQAQIDALKQANALLHQQNALLLQKIEDNRYLLEQLPQLQKKLEELQAAVEEETP